MRLVVAVLLLTVMVALDAAPYRQYYPSQSGYHPASPYYGGAGYSADNNFFPFGSAYRPHYSGYNRIPAAYRPTSYRHPVGSLSAAIPGVLGFPRPSNLPPFNYFGAAATQTVEQDVEPVLEVVESFQVKETAAEPVPVEMPVIAVEVDQPEAEFLPIEPVSVLKIEEPVAADQQAIKMVPNVTPLVEDVVQVDPLPIAESEHKPEKDVDPGTKPGQFGPVLDVEASTKGQQVKVAEPVVAVEQEKVAETVVILEEVKVAEPVVAVEQEKVAETVVILEEVKDEKPADVEQEKVAEPIQEPEPVPVDETKKTNSECKVEYILVSDSSPEGVVAAEQQQQQQDSAVVVASVDEQKPASARFESRVSSRTKSKFGLRSLGRRILKL